MSTCALCAPGVRPKSRAGAANPAAPSAPPPPREFRLSGGQEGRAEGAPAPRAGAGGAGPHLLPSPAGGGGGCARPPGPPQAGGRPGWAKAPSRAGKACGWNFPSLPELDFAGLRRREGERGRDRSATLLAAWPGWCSLGKSEHAHWGGIKGGQPERLACLLARGAASREQRAARQPAPPPRPGGRSQ